MTDFELEAADPADDDRLPTDAEWPQLLAEMMEVMRATFRRRGCDDSRAIELAEAGVIALGHHLGGRSTYLSRGDRLVRAARDRRIFLESRGNNHEALMRRFDIGTRRRLEQILAEQHAIHLGRLQPDLFAAATGT